MDRPGQSSLRGPPRRAPPWPHCSKCTSAWARCPWWRDSPSPAHLFPCLKSEGLEAQAWDPRGQLGLGFHSPKRTKHTQAFGPAWDLEEKLAQKSHKGTLPWAPELPQLLDPTPPSHPLFLLVDLPGHWTATRHGPNSQERDLVMVRKQPTPPSGGVEGWGGNPNCFLASKSPAPETQIVTGSFHCLRNTQACWAPSRGRAGGSQPTAISLSSQRFLSLSLSL